MRFTNRAVLSPQERRERNRAEMSTAILESAREIIREQGAGALNLNALARRVNLTTPALYSYFPNKFAIYDALYLQALHLMRDYDLAVWDAHEPSWERLRAWFEARLQFALDYPELYHLMFSSPIPGFTPSDSSTAETRKQLANARKGLSEIIDAEIIQPRIPTDRAVDLALAIRHGIVAERIGKANVVPANSGRFEHLIDDAVDLLRQAWGMGGDSDTARGGEQD